MFRKLFLVGVLGLLVASLGFLPIATHAQSISDFDVVGINCIFPEQPGCEGEGSSLIEQLIDFAINLAGILAVLVIVYGGYKYFFGAFTDDTAAGKKAVTAGAIGLAIVLSADLIAGLVRGTITSEGLSPDALITFIGEDVVNNFLFPISSVVAVAVIVWGGYKYLFSGLPGDQKTGLDTIKNGVIGLVVIILSYAIAGLVSSTLAGSEDGEFAFNTEGIVGLITLVINGFLIPLAAVVSLFFLVLGAYYWMTAQDKEDQVSKARTAIRNAVIGLVITILAATIVQLVILFTPSEQAEALSGGEGSSQTGGRTLTEVSDEN